MRPVLSRTQIRDFDRRWIEKGVPGLVLMENAGRGAAHLIGLKARPRGPQDKPRQGSSIAGSCIRCADERALSGVKVLVLCGPGNNGGDGFVVARHLRARGAVVETYLVGTEDALSGDALSAYRSLLALGALVAEIPASAQWAESFDSADLIVDALLGTGLTRPIEGIYGRLVDALNQSETRVISLDIPTGLCADTGVALGKAVSAFHTVTFAHLKKGLLTPGGQSHAGAITVSAIGVPSEGCDPQDLSGYLLEDKDLCALVPSRAVDVHKGAAGSTIVIAGSAGMVGAARLVAGASLRAGAGLVTIYTEPQVAAELDLQIEEIMTRPWSEDDQTLLSRAGALVIGPGLGRSAAAEAAIRRGLLALKPTVLDADALRWLSILSSTEQRKLDFSQCVLTPHPGEAAGLLDCTVAEIEGDRWLAAAKLTEKFQATVILKGSRTLISAPGRKTRVCAFGSPALATAGSGDVLSGIVAALLVGASCQDDLFEGAQLGVCLHAKAGEAWAQVNGDRGLLASELAAYVPKMLSACASEKKRQ